MCSAKARATESSNSIYGLTQLQIFTPIPYFGIPSALCKYCTNFLLVKIYVAVPVFSYSVLTFSFFISVSLWMALPLESSRTWSQMVFHSQRINRWGYTLASGMLMIGPQGVDSSRQIGHKLLSLLPIETSTQMLVYGPLGHPPAVQTLPLLLLAIMLGSHKSWIQRVSRDCSGRKRTIWYTTIAQTQRGFPKAFLQNVPHPRQKLD